MDYSFYGDEIRDPGSPKEPWRGVVHDTTWEEMLGGYVRCAPRSDEVSEDPSVPDLVDMMLSD